MIWHGIGLAAALALRGLSAEPSGAGGAEQVDTVQGDIVGPILEHSPDLQTSRYYPERAMRLDVGGSVVLRCRVEEEGRLADCATIFEEPPEFGFADATLKLSTQYRIAPKAKDGSPTIGRTVKFKANWRLPHYDPPAPAAAPPATPSP